MAEISMHHGEWAKVVGSNQVLDGIYPVASDYQVLGACSCCRPPIIELYDVSKYVVEVYDTKPEGAFDVIVGGARSDGYVGFGYLDMEGELRIRGGCHSFSLAKARQYWNRDTDLAREALAIVDKIEAEARQRGWIKDGNDSPSNDG